MAATFDDMTAVLASTATTTNTSFPTLESYVQDTLRKTQTPDEGMTNLVLDDFHFPHVDWNSDGALDPLIMTKMMKTAQEVIEGKDGNHDCAAARSQGSPLNKLELHFVDLSHQNV